MDKTNKPSGKKSKITALSLTGLLIRCAFTAVTNGYAQGFLQGKIYRGKLKLLCMPGLNCYSCPGALGSCPIGSLQAVLDSGKFRFSCYVLGFLVLFGAVLGRFVCGWLCPFGLVQDLLHKIPLFQKKKNLPGHRVLRWLKFVVLGLLTGRCWCCWRWWFCQSSSTAPSASISARWAPSMGCLTRLPSTAIG